MKQSQEKPSEPAEEPALQPKHSTLFWANVLVLVPFAVLLMRAFTTHSSILVFWAFTIAPAALVTIAVDIYTIVQHKKHP